MILDNQAASFFSICFICGLDLVVWNLHMRLSCILLKPASSPVIEAGVSAVKMVDHNWSAQVLKRDKSSAVQSHGSGINPTAINRFHWTLLREWEAHLHLCIPLFFFFPWKRGAKISSLTLLPVLITSVLMSCTPSVKCTSRSLF